MIVFSLTNMPLTVKAIGLLLPWYFHCLTFSWLLASGVTYIVIAGMDGI